jgi:hypothetical protein
MLVTALLAVGCEDLPDAPADWRDTPIRGITIVDWSRDGYCNADPAMLQEIRGTGATHLSILTTAYQSDPHANRIHADPERTPSIESLRRLLADARAAGFATTLKPHVDSDDGSWRAFIDPSDPDAWFASYRAWILPLAALADSAGCSALILGSELAGTIRHEEQWRDLIRDVRSIYHGDLLYAASWDEAFNVPFWDALDFIGIDYYFPVTVRRDPGRLEILEGWQPTLERIHMLARRAGRPVVLTEVGYRSVDGAGRMPWDFQTDGSIDLTEQSDLYWGMLEAVSSSGWISGLYLWNWEAGGGGGESDRGYTPRGKPALRELSSAWGR